MDDTEQTPAASSHDRFGAWWWQIGDDEICHTTGSAEAAHVEARARIDDDHEPGTAHEYTIGQTEKPLDTLDANSAGYIGRRIDEQVNEWLDDAIRPEDPVMLLTREQAVELGDVVLAWLRQHGRFTTCGGKADTESTHKHTAGAAP